MTDPRLTTPLNGLDYAAPISAASLHAWGVHFVGRYLSNSPWKNLSWSEAEALRHYGINFFTVWEDGATDAYKGYYEGRLQAEQHVAMARALGKKDGVGFYYFAVDTDVDHHPEWTDNYFDGIASIIPKEQCGPYGGIEVVSHQLDRGFGAAWQTIAWSYGQVDPRAKILQYEVSYIGSDHDHAYYDNYGQWAYVPPPPPDPNHYKRFLGETFTLHNRKFNERNLVETYDAIDKLYRKHPRKYAAKRMYLKRELKVCRDRIMSLAKRRPHHHAQWDIAWRGWRWQELDRRINSRH